MTCLSLGERNLVGKSEPKYLRIFEFMWKDLKLNGVTLLVYAHVYSFTLNEKDFFESREGTAEYLGVSERAVTKAFKKLESMGLIMKTGQHRLKSGRSTKSYRATFVSTGTVCPSRNTHLPEHGSPEKSAPHKAATGEQISKPRVQKVHPDQNSIRKRDDQKGGESRYAKYDF